MRKVIAVIAIAGAAVAVPTAAFASTPKVVVHQYEVVSGSYKSHVKADARLTKLQHDGFNQFVVVAKGKRFLVEEGPETWTVAKALRKSLHTKHLGSYITRAN